MTSTVGKLPSDETLVACHESNDDGIGLAWQAPDGTVSLRKGIKLSYLKKLLLRVSAQKAAYVLHFRAATSCGVEDRLCHPFPMTTAWDRLGALRADGLNAIVAHNGTWRDWERHFPEAERAWLKANNWSDSAIIAWLLANGKEISLPVSGYGNRLAFLSQRGGIKLWGDGWSVEEDGISYSNTFWRYVARRSWSAGGVGRGGGAGAGRGYYYLDDWPEFAPGVGAQAGTSWCPTHSVYDRCWAAQSAKDKASGGACELTKLGKRAARRAAKAAKAKEAAATGASALAGGFTRHYRGGKRVAGPLEEVIANRIYRKFDGYLVATGDRLGDPPPANLLPPPSGNAEDRAALAAKEDK